MMSLPDRLHPANIAALLRYGVIDLGALLCYGAALLVIGLFIWALRRRTNASRIALLGAVLLLLVALGPGCVPPLYIDASPGQVATPSAAFLARLAESSAESPARVRLGAPSALLTAFLSRTGSDHLQLLSPQPEATAPDSLFVLVGAAATEIPYDRIFCTNPAAPEGEPKLWFNLESELLQAVALLKSPAPHIYRLAGPDDPDHPSILMDAVRAITPDALTPLDLSAAVPLDCTFVLIDNPQVDLTAPQAAILRSYLGRGGRLLLLTDYIHGAMPNLGSALEEYGLAAIDGAALDPGSAMGGRAEYPMPEAGAGHVIGRWLSASGRMPLLPLSHGIELLPIDGVDSAAVLLTTDEAYLQLNALDHESLDAGPDDLPGPFALAAGAEMGNGRVLWIASADAMSVIADADVGGANAELLRAAIRWLMDAQIEPIAAIPLRG